MKNAHENVLTTVGNTPLVKLNSVTRGLKATVWAKVEYMNPGGSVKDRIALKMIEDAERRGDLKPGGTIVEGTSGNTGAGLAMVAAIKGYKCIFVLPDKQSEEKRAALRAYGAKVVVTPTDVEPADPRSYYSVSTRLGTETPNAFFANQYHNPSNPQAHYEITGPELWDQTEGAIDVFIGGLGTGGTITGTGKYLKEQNQEVKIVGVDPVGSLYYDYFRTGQLTPAFSYIVEGIGEDFLPSTMDFQYVDDVVRVNDAECMKMTRRLCREEGLFVGGSCGAAVAGALKWVKAHDREGMNVVVLLPDSGSRYLSKIYNDQWMLENGFLEDEPSPLGTVAEVMAELGDRTTVTATPDMDVSHAIGLLKSHGISQMPVMASDDKVVGVIHERLLLEEALKRKSVPARVGELADQRYCTVGMDTEVTVMTDLLRKVPVALVFDGERFQGVLTRIDVLDHIARRAG
ncbi:MAG: cystathionine beta-synthase [Myxococcota bacterium]